MRILILSSIWPETTERLQREFDCLVSINPADGEKHRLLADAEVVIVRSPVRLDRAALESARNLKLIIRAGAGLDAIDVPLAKSRGVVVIAVPLSADSVAEHSIGLLLSVCRRIPQLNHALRQGRWEKHSGLGIQLSGKTLGLVGFGRIGIRTAELAKAFRMNLLAHDRSPEKSHKRAAAERLAVRFLPLDDLFAGSDFILIQTPLDETTRGLVDGHRLALMKATAVLVNVGRGGVVDERSLYDALRGGRLAGAAMDVFQSEPLSVSGQLGNHPLLSLDNFVATPHVAAQTIDAQRCVGEDVAKIVHAFSSGQSLVGLGIVI
ncbi:hydroxyacid dehydrogenase [Stieleria sp. ICT_E10.1]|uniref:hydroxyacid dehydrogenase n=1 Tax=Stieleria sedimenti TaxID=2976331 RepID=UPI002180954D|nr:hydroxyacid dehydrogenase [Stieleria sedimenti]MCS7468883.1 hydroxyacid dehydrogenase [Stieleria sedimenti]